MKKVFLLALLLLAIPSRAQQVLNTEVLVDSAAYFPQLSDDGRWLMYSNTEGTSLWVKNLKSGITATVWSGGYPGFDARFDASGNIYYVTWQRKPNGLLFRSGHRYNPATMERRQVLKPQHGQVVTVRAGREVVIEGEKKSYRSGRPSTYAFTRGSWLHIVMPDGKTLRCQPAGECAGYLWAQVSPSGDKVLFEAAGRGLYVCDLQGRVLHRLEKCLMPSWYDDEYILAMGNNGNVQREMRSGVILLKADGSGRWALTPDDGDGMQPVRTTDGRILYTTKQGTVKIMTITLEK